MLASLSIRDIVLIDRLDLELSDGLTVLTGETGAGKSILLDSLALATGRRADRALVRQGADQGVVTAEFTIGRGHAACRFIEEQGLDSSAGQIILRRQVTREGRSRAWINDQPVSQSLLRDIGDLLLEVHGQHDDRGLLDAAAHRALLDAFGQLEPAVRDVAYCWRRLSAARHAQAEAEADLAAARHDEDYLRHAVDELAALAPETGEEKKLADNRAAMMQGQQLAGDLQSFSEILTGGADGGVDATVRGILRRMERLDQGAQDRLAPVIAALDRAAIELDEAIGALDTVTGDLEFDPAVLEMAEERLFEVRRLARKHDCEADALASLLDGLKERLARLEAGDDAVRAAAEAVAAADADMRDKVMVLRTLRHEAAKQLDAAVTAELAPLKLDKAVFRTRVEPLDPADWGASGGDRVEFVVQTNPSTPFGPLVKIASGGELARFILALKIVLAQGAGAPVMVFDEVDRGIGGATADAVGERLSRLAARAQVLIVTHSPQVAARGDSHFRIAKTDRSGTTHTDVSLLSLPERKEEIARMLSGAEISREARAAADRLLKGETGRAQAG
ncbi:DNA repair protein RecN [Eilatimonas milleporae]|uniref:DNA repair protein RecN n=1 Tax=Eilatimonas milleporae TaxID=911205 RepID=A0A3M0CQJ6_9PROT|nr:DNA repair protein RecN [Eilatimonas milleporae]RMB11762.1 DNA replication and repair protein RecN [Eilatimonas milleporae]